MIGKLVCNHNKVVVFMVDTVGGRYPAPVDTWFLPLFIGFNHPK
jgi:hypothetical protein